MATSKEESAKVAEDVAPKKRCAETAHVWSLPDQNPFNGVGLSSGCTCSRCGAIGKFTIVVG